MELIVCHDINAKNASMLFEFAFVVFEWEKKEIEEFKPLAYALLEKLAMHKEGTRIAFTWHNIACVATKSTLEELTRK